jgi:hypothetical protein
MVNVIPQYEYVVKTDNEINRFRTCSGFFRIMRDTNSDMRVGAGGGGGAL